MIYSSSHLPEEDAHIWNLDSGCTSHMSPREDWLINKIPIDSEINLAEEERVIKAEAQGDVKLSTYTSEAIENNHSERPLELIHMDLCGPMPTKSLGGAKYLYVIVDSYSRRIFVYFLKSKEDAFDFFVEFKNHRENETNVKIKNVRSDNGTEFANKKFNEFFRNEGIHHQRTVPYSPQSNGIAERTNHTLLDWARTMLFDAKLPTEFWAEAIATAAYLKNCTPTKNDNMKTPIEKWTGHKPSVAHLKIFGSLAYYYIPKNQRNKFDSRARKGIFTGYSRQRKAYRIYDPQDGKIHEVQTVKFDENSKGSDLLTSNVFDQHVQDHIIYRNEQHESDFFQITHTMGSTPEELNTPDNPEPIPESSGLPRKPGRIAGRTNEDIQAKHLINLQEQEERLRASGVRRSERIKERNAANVTELSSTSMNIPKTYREAMNTPFSDQWKEAMEEEFHSLTSHNVWTLVPKPENENLIKGKWIFNIKLNPDGSIDKRKARFVAMGHNQKPGVDYEESFAPVMKLDSLRTLIAIASQQNMKIEQYDVKTAYLNAELKDDVYLEQPEGFVQAGQENKVCKLNRSLYGLPQSGRCWNEKINQIFNDIGLRRLESEPCAYILQEEEKTLIIGIYVDDFLIIGSDSTIINRIVKQLDKQIVIVRKEKPIFFLGIKIEEKENCFELSQEAYVEKILKKFNLEECNPVKTPGCTDRSDLLHGQDTTTSVGRHCDQGARNDLICSMDKTLPPPLLAVIVIRMYGLIRSAPGQDTPIKVTR
ncbi:hypothetical protein LAZ67_3004952 [Cordylochernes scorpioides]|uniref:Integrase catalytic domain-containing protein n=1 Tax=Cordylochernes scorpioides TaxID=51811 RepID=A0ABY6KAP9_9ARAC|nr:hypothetical protein LAZ67_3004952 [Cordylochernes scorpioides]